MKVRALKKKISNLGKNRGTRDIVRVSKNLSATQTTLLYTAVNTNSVHSRNGSIEYGIKNASSVDDVS